MNPAISVELRFFLTSILWGVILLVAYDGLRILRRLIKHDEFFVALEDMIFWVIASLFIFAMIYHMNNGIIRGFSVMGMTLGGVLYHFAFSDLLVKWLTTLIRVLLKPISMVMLKGKRLLGFAYSKTFALVKKLLYRLKKLIKSVKITLKKCIWKPDKHNKAKKQKIQKKAKNSKKARKKDGEGRRRTDAAHPRKNASKVYQKKESSKE
jgi:spore cortex biosynthesis protein YabQ